MVEIRQRVLRDGVSKRQILPETGMHWETLQKILQHPSPPGYQRKNPPKQPKIALYRDGILQILEQVRHIRRKQRHAAKKIWEVLQAGWSFRTVHCVPSNAWRSKDSASL